MYWDEFSRILRTHAAPNVNLHFALNRWGPGDRVSIFDSNRVMRAGVLHTGKTHEDFHRDSFVLNAGWHNGEIPSLSYQGDFKYAEETIDGKAGWRTRPHRGWKEALQRLIGLGTIIPGRQLDLLLGINTRKLAPFYNRLYYLR